jgi:transposase
MSLMAMPDLKLPDDVDALKAMVLAMAEKAEGLETEVADLRALNASADERIARLTSILKAFERARFGRRSEKLGSNALDEEQRTEPRSSSTRSRRGSRPSKRRSINSPVQIKPSAPRVSVKVLRPTSSGSKS